MVVWNFIAAFFAAALAAMGVGGGGLLVIYLIFALSMPQIKAQGINLIFFLCASICSLPFHIKKKRIDWKTVAVFAPAGAIGAYFGCRAALGFDPKYVRLVFGYLLVFAGLITLSKSLIPTLLSFRGCINRFVKAKLENKKE